MKYMFLIQDYHNIQMYQNKKHFHFIKSSKIRNREAFGTARLLVLRGSWNCEALSTTRLLELRGFWDCELFPEPRCLRQREAFSSARPCAVHSLHRRLGRPCYYYYCYYCTINIVSIMSRTI